MSEAIDKRQTQALQARRENRLADARHDLLEALALSRQANDRRALIHTLKALGQIERDLGQGDAALPLYEEAVYLCREEADPLLLAHTIRHLGDIHLDAARPALAEPCYHEALALYRAHKQTLPLDLANAVRPLAILKDDAGQVAEARQLWQEARDLYASVNIAQGVAESSRRLALLANRPTP